MKLARIQGAVIAAALIIVATPAPGAQKAPKKDPPPSALDIYIRDAAKRTEAVSSSSGSLWSPVALFNDLGADLRARHVDDVVTIVVSEQTSAVSGGVTKTSRASAVSSSITAAYGLKKPTSSLSNLAGANTSTSQIGRASCRERV